MAMSGMAMGPMQGGRAPAGARSPDYSDGIARSTMPGMDMVDDAPIGMLLIDQLEAFHGHDGNGQSWELQGWYGNDANKLWLRSEGERSAGGWRTAISRRCGATPLPPTGTPRWGCAMIWARARAATGWPSASRAWRRTGSSWRRPAMSVRPGAPRLACAPTTTCLFTQRLILQPELELNLYGRDDPARRVGAGLADVQCGLRLRYDIRREFAPYVGVQFVRRLGRSADFARADGTPVLDRQFVAGSRFWF